LLVEQKATVGLNRGAAGIGTSAVVRDDRTPTLADIGVSKDLSSHAQRVAAIPSDEFEGIVGQWRDTLENENERVTTNILAAGGDAQRTRFGDGTELPQRPTLADIGVDKKLSSHAQKVAAIPAAPEEKTPLRAGLL
jgi:hypothetical protein